MASAKMWAFENSAVVYEEAGRLLDAAELAEKKSSRYARLQPRPQQDTALYPGHNCCAVCARKMAETESEVDEHGNAPEGLEVVPPQEDGEALLACAHCGGVAYCSSAHRDQDRAVHSAVCNRIRLTIADGEAELEAQEAHDAAVAAAGGGGDSEDSDEQEETSLPKTPQQVTCAVLSCLLSGMEPPSEALAAKRDGGSDEEDEDGHADDETKKQDQATADGSDDNSEDCSEKEDDSDDSSEEEEDDPIARARDALQALPTPRAWSAVLGLLHPGLAAPSEAAAAAAADADADADGDSTGSASGDDDDAGAAEEENPVASELPPIALQDSALASRIRLLSEALSYPLTLLNALLHTPEVVAVRRAMAGAKRPMLVHVLGASVAECACPEAWACLGTVASCGWGAWGGAGSGTGAVPGSPATSGGASGAGKDGNGKASASTSASASASASVSASASAPGSGDAGSGSGIRVVFVGLEVPKRLHRSSVRVRPDVELQYYRSAYHHYVKKFHMGLSCDDYDWEETLETMKRARAPLLSTVAISDEVELDGVTLSWNGLQLARMARNHVAPLRYHQSGTLANDIFCKNAYTVLYLPLSQSAKGAIGTGDGARRKKSNKKDKPLSRRQMKRIERRKRPGKKRRAEILARKQRSERRDASDSDGDGYEAQRSRRGVFKKQKRRHHQGRPKTFKRR